MNGVSWLQALLAAAELVLFSRARRKLQWLVRKFFLAHFWKMVPDAQTAEVPLHLALRLERMLSCRIFLAALLCHGEGGSPPSGGGRATMGGLEGAMVTFGQTLFGNLAN